MKIYLADTIQRDSLGYNVKFLIQNHLESYFAIIRKKERIDLWNIFDEDLFCADRVSKRRLNEN